MKNKVSFETALALKAAGFPQPEPEAGQVWYDSEGLPFIVIWTFQDEVGFYYSWDDSNADPQGFLKYIPNTFTYSPTAEDILQELPQTTDYPISISGSLVKVWAHNGKRMEPFFFGTYADLIDNLAAAWLELKKG